jgi:hypothetical protein
MLLKIVVGPDLEPSENLSISPLDLTIAPGRNKAGFQCLRSTLESIGL